MSYTDYTYNTGVYEQQPAGSYDQASYTQQAMYTAAPAPPTQYASHDASVPDQQHYATAYDYGTYTSTEQYSSAPQADYSHQAAYTTPAAPTQDSYYSYSAAPQTPTNASSSAGQYTSKQSPGGYSYQGSGGHYQQTPSSYTQQPQAQQQSQYSNPGPTAQTSYSYDQSATAYGSASYQSGADTTAAYGTSTAAGYDTTAAYGTSLGGGTTYGTSAAVDSYGNSSGAGGYGNHSADYSNSAAPATNDVYTSGSSYPDGTWSANDGTSNYQTDSSAGCYATTDQSSSGYQSHDYSASAGGDAGYGGYSSSYTDGTEVTCGGYSYTPKSAQYNKVYDNGSSSSYGGRGGSAGYDGGSSYGGGRGSYDSSRSSYRGHGSGYDSRGRGGSGAGYSRGSGDRTSYSANSYEKQGPQDFGGYSGPAPSSRGGGGGWRGSSDRSRGGSFGRTPPSQGGRRPSGYNDSRGGHSYSGGRGGSSTSFGGYSGGPQLRHDGHRGGRGGSSSQGGGGWRGGRTDSSNTGSNSFGNRHRQDSGGFDARNYRDNQGRGGGRGGLGSGGGKLQPSAYSKPQPVKAEPPKDDGPAYMTPKPQKKVEGTTKAPSRPQDRLLNEVEEKEKREAEERKKQLLPPQERKKQEEATKNLTEEEKKQLEEAAKKREEEAKLKAEEAKKKELEALRNKLADEAVKAAPPPKKPETPEEIAREAEIQRKIRESVVVLANPIDEPQGPPAPKTDVLAELKMSDEVKELLSTLTTQYLCKLCSVRIIGPQMASMHYSGKNHTKKLRNFVATNGRSAGFYLGGEKKEGEAAKDEGEGKDGNNKAEAVAEETAVDENRYCKVCDVTFSQPSQAEIHYKGKNHAKKVRNSAGPNGTGPKIFECKICCVAVMTQEHLDAHLNGSRHMAQIRKIDAIENFSDSMPNRGRGGLGYRGRGRGGGGDWRSSEDGGRGRGGFRGRGRGDFRGRGNNYAEKRKGVFGDYTDEEMVTLFSIEPAKRYCFDLANYRTPSGHLYCSSCDVSLDDEPKFLLHLGSRKHRDKVGGKKKRPVRAAGCFPLLDSSSNHARRD